MISARAIALAGCLLVGCSTTGDHASASKTPIPPPSATGVADCFYARQVQNFLVLDRSNLIVYAPNDAAAYHVRVSRPSTELRSADRLAFLPANDRICGYAGERLIVGIGFRAESLPIIDVSRLAPASLEALRGENGGNPVPVAHPEPGPGPDIEKPADGADGSP